MITCYYYYYYYPLEQHLLKCKENDFDIAPRFQEVNVSDATSLNAAPSARWDAIVLPPTTANYSFILRCRGKAMVFIEKCRLRSVGFTSDYHEITMRLPSDYHEHP